MEQSLFSSTSLQPKQKNKRGKIRKKKEYTFSPQPLPFVLKRSSSFEIFYFSFYNFKFVLNGIAMNTYFALLYLQTYIK